MTSSAFVTPRGLGARFEIDARFVDTDPGCVPVEADATRLPTAHFIAARPAEGWIAALALVTVATEPAPAPEWLAGHLARAQASFAGGRRPPGRVRPLPSHGALARRRRGRCRPRPVFACRALDRAGGRTPVAARHGTHGPASGALGPRARGVRAPLSDARAHLTQPPRPLAATSRGAQSLSS